MMSIMYNTADLDVDFVNGIIIRHQDIIVVNDQVVTKVEWHTSNGFIVSDSPLMLMCHRAMGDNKPNAFISTVVLLTTAT